MATVDIEIMASSMPAIQGLLGTDIEIMASSIPAISESLVCAAGAGLIPSTIISPAVLSALAPRDAIVVEVELDETLFLGMVISVRIRSKGTHDVIYSNNLFSDKFVALSREVPLSTGRRFTIRPSAGWPRDIIESEPNDVELLVLGFLTGE